MIGSSESPFLSDNERASIDAELNVQQLLTEIVRQKRFPPSREKVIGAMWSELLPVFDEQGPVMVALRDFVSGQRILQPNRPDVGVPISEVAGKIRVSLQYIAMQYHDTIPLHMYTRTTWRHVIEQMVQVDTQYGDFLTILNYLNVPTTLQKRYAPFEAVRQLWSDPTAEGINWWEGGSSLQIGAKATQLKSKYPFEASRVVRLTGGRLKSGKSEMEPDRIAGLGYQRLLGRTAIGGGIVGTDIWTPRDALMRRLAVASLRPSEIGDPDFMTQFTGLMDAELHNVYHTLGDITDYHYLEAVRRQFDGSPVEMGFLGTMLNQVGQEHVDQTIRHAMELLDEDGILFILEFGRPDPACPSKFQLAPTWKDWTYGFFAIHKADPDRTIQPLLQFKNSRMTHMIVGAGVLDVGNGYRTMREHLASVS